MAGLYAVLLLILNVVLILHHNDITKHYLVALLGDFHTEPFGCLTMYTLSVNSMPCVGTGVQGPGTSVLVNSVPWDNQLSLSLPERRLLAIWDALSEVPCQVSCLSGTLSGTKSVAA